MELSTKPNLSANLDLELVRELKKGSIDAFNKLFEAYGAKLYRFAFAYFKSKEEAEEMVQDIFTNIWEKRGEIKEEYHFRSYLFSIAYNYTKKYFRSQCVVSRYLDAAKSTLCPDTDETQEYIDYMQLKEMVDRIVDEMPVQRKAVFIKSRYEGKSYKEIAEEMNISPKTVENHLNLATKFIKEHLNAATIDKLLYICLFIVV